jgi:ATP-dependent Lhr-like helicase
LLDIFDFVSPASAERVLTQAVLQAPMFGTRFRWAAGRALALSRVQQWQAGAATDSARARAEDLIAAVFPEQVGCQDNHGGQELELPDHPSVAETMKDCLRDFMDVDGLVAVLRALKDGGIKKVAVDLPEPSVFAHQLLNSAPYTFLDDAPLEERRARAVSVRRTLPPADAASFGALDQAAIDQVAADAAPVIRDAEELHDSLLLLGLLRAARVDSVLLAELQAQRRAAMLSHQGKDFVFAAERVPLVRALFPGVTLALAALPGDAPVERESAARQVVRGWMEVLGPTTVGELGALLGCLDRSEVEFALAKLEGVGQVLRGRFRPTRAASEGGVAEETEWCDRRLLQRIHRLTVGRLRREIEPLTAQDFMRFLFRWQHLDAESKLRGPLGVTRLVTLLQGYEAPAAAWERDLLPARMHQYVGEWLEQACFSGEVAWGRLTTREAGLTAPAPRRGLPVDPPVTVRRPTVTRAASLTFVRRAELDWLLEAARPELRLADGPNASTPADLSGPARDVLAVLERRGASFFAELQSGSRRLAAEVEDALWELLARGFITADAVQNLRVLQSPKLRRRQRALQRGGPGRWSLLQCHERTEPDALQEKLARLFLNRYGIVFRDLVVREPLAPPWRELLVVYRRLEARGELRGGRFLSGFAGEQFALPEAVDLARAVRRTPLTGQVIRLAAVDPLNLTGVVTPGPRIAAMLGQHVLYVDGVPAAPTSPAPELDA